MCSFFYKEVITGLGLLWLTKKPDKLNHLKFISRFTDSNSIHFAKQSNQKQHQANQVWNSPCSLLYSVIYSDVYIYIYIYYIYIALCYVRLRLLICPFYSKLTRHPNQRLTFSRRSSTSITDSSTSLTSDSAEMLIPAIPAIPAMPVPGWNFKEIDVATIRKPGFGETMRSACVNDAVMRFSGKKEKATSFRVSTCVSCFPIIQQ